MKYLVVCDLDGSLLNNSGKISNYTKEILHKIDKIGHKVVIATGRPFSGAINIYNSLEIKNILITDNGGSIHHPHDKNFTTIQHFIPKKITHKLFLETKKFLNSAFYSDEKNVYAYKYDPRLQMFFSSLDQRKVIDKPFNEFDTEATGIIYLVKTDFIESFEKYMIESWKNILSFRMWGKDKKHAIYEIYLSHISKASAIDFTRKKYNILKENTIAFGDGINDFEMIKYSNPGVAMKNGIIELKLSADQITEYNNDENGIAIFLEKFFKIS